MDTTPPRETTYDDVPAGPARPRRTVAALLTALALVLGALVTGAVTAAPAGANSAEDTVTAKLNYARTSRGLPRLAVRSSLVAVARAQAQRMASSDTLYHNPRLTSDVTNWRFVGENVGYGPDALTVHVAFMQSAPHRANILDRDYTEIGIGAVVVGDRVWIAEVFRRPMTVATTSSPRFASFRHTLRLGSTGADVQRVQQRLHLRVTGYYGTYTRDAVTRFQRTLGWRGCGKVGPHTWSRLF